MYAEMVQLFTIGHSTQPLDAFLATLAAYAIERLVDVRRFPASRRHPHYNGPALASTLHTQGVDYLHLPDLGGRRPARKDSRNVRWRNASFRGYADHMETPAYRTAIDHLIEAARTRRSAVMCAEKLWWQCHRSLIADDLKAAGHEVTHILSAERAEPHTFTAPARLVNGRLSYEDLLP